MFSFLRYRMVSADLSAMREEIDKEVSKHRGWYIFEGLLFLVVGALALFCLAQRRWLSKCLWLRF